MFSYCNIEERVLRQHPQRRIRTMVNRALESVVGAFRGTVCALWRPSIPPGATAAGAAVAGAVLDPQRATVDGADRVQPAVPLVCGLEFR